MICKMCWMSEQDSESSEDDEYYAEQAAKPSDFTLIATVSYNKDRKDFTQEGVKSGVFEGADMVDMEYYKR